MAKSESLGLWGRPSSVWKPRAQGSAKRCEEREREREREKTRERERERERDRERERSHDLAPVKLDTTTGAPMLHEGLTAVGFEPTQLALVELESTPLDHSGKLSLCSRTLGGGKAGESTILLFFVRSGCLVRYPIISR